MHAGNVSARYVGSCSITQRYYVNTARQRTISELGPTSRWLVTNYHDVKEGIQQQLPSPANRPKGQVVVDRCGSDPKFRHLIRAKLPNSCPLLKHPHQFSGPSTIFHGLLRVPTSAPEPGLRHAINTTVEIATSLVEGSVIGIDLDYTA